MMANVSDSAVVNVDTRDSVIASDNDSTAVNVASKASGTPIVSGE